MLRHDFNFKQSCENEMTAENRKLKLFSTRFQLSFFQQTNKQKLNLALLLLRKTRVQTDQNSFERSIKHLVSKNHILYCYILLILIYSFKFSRVQPFREHERSLKLKYRN